LLTFGQAKRHVDEYVCASGNVNVMNSEEVTLTALQQSIFQELMSRICGPISGFNVLDGGSTRRRHQLDHSKLWSVAKREDNPLNHVTGSEINTGVVETSNDGVTWTPGRTTHRDRRATRVGAEGLDERAVPPLDTTDMRTTTASTGG